MKENKQWNSAQIQTWCWYLYTQYAQNILTCALQHHRSSQKHTLFANTVSQADRYSPVFLTILWPSPVRSDWPIKCHCLMSSTSESTAICHNLYTKTLAFNNSLFDVVVFFSQLQRRYFKAYTATHHKTDTGIWTDNPPNHKKSELNTQKCVLRNRFMLRFTCADILSTFIFWSKKLARS